jgi:hypothetical protein
MKPRFKLESQVQVHGCPPPHHAVSANAIWESYLSRIFRSNHHQVITSVFCLQCAAVCMACATVGSMAMEPANATLHTLVPAAIDVSISSFLNASPDHIGPGVCISYLHSSLGLYRWGISKYFVGSNQKI